MEEDKSNEFQKVENINSSARSTEIISDKVSESNKSSGCKFPTAYTILVIIEFIFFILTYIIPKGKFDTIEYSDGKFIVKSFNKTDKLYNATKEVLEELGIKIPLANFIDGYIKGAISIPNTYKEIEGENKNFFSVFVYPIKGLIDSCGIAFFLFVLGGTINILIEMNALSAGIAALGRVTKGREFILLILVLVITSFGGTTFGFMEEVLPFYPILIPIFMKSGFDGILGMGGLFLGSMMGCMFSTVNAFSVVIASYSAGINFVDGIYFRLVCLALGDILATLYLYFYYLRIKKDMTKSVVYDIRQELEEKYLKEEKKDNDVKVSDEEENLLLKEKEQDKNDKFTWPQKLGLIILMVGFGVMIYGVLALNWWFEHMTAVFLIAAIIFMFLYNEGEQKGIDVFIRGASEFVGVSIVIGLARGINITLDEGNISDTILNAMINLIDGFPKILFAILMLIIFIILGFFIQSSSGLAVLSMPVFAPLADNANCSRTVVINAYMMGQYLIGFIAPTGICLIVLQLVGIPYNYWIKFIWPYLLICFIFLIVLIIVNAAFFGDIN